MDKCSYQLVYICYIFINTLFLTHLMGICFLVRINGGNLFSWSVGLNLMSRPLYVVACPSNEYNSLFLIILQKINHMILSYL